MHCPVYGEHHPTERLLDGEKCVFGWVGMRSPIAQPLFLPNSLATGLELLCPSRPSRVEHLEELSLPEPASSFLSNIRYHS